jgi:hypothetical protein
LLKGDVEAPAQRGLAEPPQQSHFPHATANVRIHGIGSRLDC